MKKSLLSALGLAVALAFSMPVLGTSSANAASSTATTVTTTTMTPAAKKPTHKKMHYKKMHYKKHHRKAPVHHVSHMKPAAKAY
jgi:hypothetical protein